MADNVPLGMEFMRWQSLPSVADAVGKSKLLKGLGILLAGSGAQEETPAAPLGQGVAPPTIGGNIGLNPMKSSGIGIAPGQFQMPNLTLPQIGQAMPQQGVDLDGDGQIDNFWGVKKL